MVKGHPNYNGNSNKLVQVVRPQNNNHPSRTGNIVKQRQQVKASQNNGRGNERKASNNRSERNIGKGRG